MRLQLAAFRPVIRLVVMIHIAKQQTALRLVHDDANVATYPNRPEVLVFCFVELMETIAGIGRVDLEIEGGRFDGFLFFPIETSEAISKGVGDTEVHYRAISFGAAESCFCGSLTQQQPSLACYYERDFLMLGLLQLRI